MDKLELLRDALKSKAFTEEPLALAILYCLEHNGIIEHTELINAFHKVIDSKIDRLIEDEMRNNQAGEINS